MDRSSHLLVPEVVAEALQRLMAWPVLSGPLAGARLKSHLT